MGDLRVCYPNGDVSSHPSSFPPPACTSIATESWDAAEETARRIISRVQPTLDADRKRKQVVDYVQRLIQDGLGYQVFPYGSVPLKTYLPDGDIDLTTLSSPAIEDTLASDVHAILRDIEQHYQNAPFQVKDVHCIDAEVKLVKCLVQNIVVDISFNQLGGLCTLCFLEQVDHLVGKDHLFKRSIILIKAWCYYESRILGAHHGLISTYALETLVLYIFHLFHSSLNGPIAVLYKFLDYFSKFDWENYCVSLNGPVCKSSLPDIVAECPKNAGHDPLLSEEFLRKCINMFSVPSRDVEKNLRLFPLKHLNIIDPLKGNNNLGRSVNRGNYYRIQSALKYGACKLGQILILPRERIAVELVKFFANTLERQGGNHFSDMQNLSLTSEARGSDHLMTSVFASMCSENYLLAKPVNVGSHNDKISEPVAASRSRYKLGCPFNVSNSQVVPERKINAKRNTVSGQFHPGDAKEFVVSELLAMKSKSHSSDYFPLSSNLGASVSAKPQIYIHNGRSENGHSSKTLLTDSIAADDKRFAVKPYSKNNILVDSNVGCKRELAGIFGDSRASKSLLDLSGDYDGQFWSVLYGQYCHLFAVSTSILPSPPVPLHLEKENHWEAVEQSIPLKRDPYSQRDLDGILGPQFGFPKPPASVFPAFDSDDKKKRGTRTYIPKKRSSNRERPLRETRIFQAHNALSQLQKHTSSNNGCATIQQQMALSEEGSHKLSAEEYPALVPVKSGSSNTPPPCTSVWGSSAANVLSSPPERFDSGSCNLELQSTELPQENELPEWSIPCTCGSSLSVTVASAQSAKPLPESNQESDAGRSYHLKNEHDFPPLSL